ncbi:MAG: alpha/beta fold hydrolase [Bacteroidia bacterium]|nr:alpha/beta fold hydrolase [Bacteroidia bacterium]
MILFHRSYGSGHPVLIFHGLFGQSDNWTTIARQLAEEGYLAITVDLRNHGLSPHHPDFDYPSMAHDIHDTMLSLGISSPVLIGHSMGAKAVMFYDHLFPGSAKGVIVVDMAMRKYEGHHHSVLEGLNAIDLDHIKTRNEADLQLSKYIKELPVRQFLLKNLHRSEESPEKLAWRFNLKVITEKYYHILQSVPKYASQTPVSLIYGKHSGYITNEDISDFKQTYSAFEHHEIKDCGHWVHAEKPREFLEASLSFLRKIFS